MPSLKSVVGRLLGLYRLIPGIVTDHLPYLITDLLPVANEVAGLFPAQYFNAFLFEDRDDGFRIASLTGVLPIRNRSEGRRNPIEFSRSRVPGLTRAHSI